VFLKTAITNLVLYGSGLGWSCVGLLRQSSEVGPGYYLHLEGLVGSDAYVGLQNTKHSYLIHAGSAYTICVLFLFLLMLCCFSFSAFSVRFLFLNTLSLPSNSSFFFMCLAFYLSYPAWEVGLSRRSLNAPFSPTDLCSFLFRLLVAGL
jgi:hypothetical protein